MYKQQVILIMKKGYNFKYFTSLWSQVVSQRKALSLVMETAQLVVSTAPWNRCMRTQLIVEKSAFMMLDELKPVRTVAKYYILYLEY